MIPEVQTLYYYEIDHARLDFDADPVYQKNMARALAELGTAELSPPSFPCWILRTRSPLPTAFALVSRWLDGPCGGERVFPRRSRRRGRLR